jgi:selenocysteine-specific elongation factor
MIIGTAGHIDHGKTALVRALTGVDTDRLPEEKRRGITIELGFAPLELAGVGTVGVVDVPGHEAFVRTMVAGATGIDLALLVVAADEGVMPQTREHLAILGLLGTRGGVVALTKCDLVDGEWLDLVRAEVVEILRGTALAGAAVVPTSVVTGAGLDRLREALGAAATGLPERDASDVFRMPIDRVFTVRGTGTVVTGTVWSGTLAAESSIVLHPAGRPVRVRGVQSHGRNVMSIGPATRAAVALAGVDVASVERGSWLVGDAHWTSSLVMRADVALLADADALRAREWVRLHLGTTEVAARVVAPGGPMAPGQRRGARVLVHEPIPARAGDRFVLRRASPVATIGGGIVVDPVPPGRRARPWPRDEVAPADRLLRLAREAGRAGVALSTLPQRMGVRAGDVPGLIERTPSLAVVAGRVLEGSEIDRASGEVERLVDAHHAGHPLEAGIPVAALRGAAGELLDEVLSRLGREGRLVTHGAVVSRPGWHPTMSRAQSELRDRLLSDLRRAGTEPPTVMALAELHHSDVTPLLRILDREGLVLAVEGDRYYAAEAVRDLVRRLRDGMTKGREYSPAELRDILGVSRKYLIPFLEYCDRQRITERRGGGRVLLDA